jgi:hypothetical protein
MSKARDIASAAPAPSTVSATELGYLDGVTSAVQTQIDSKLATATASSTYQAIVSGVNDTEIGYLDGVTSAIQTQIDSKIGQATAINPSTITAKGDLIVGTGSGTFTAQGVGANGTVLTANSAQADGVEWAALPASGGMTVITSGSVPTGTSTFTISSIPSTYTDLRVVFFNLTRVTTPGDLFLILNGISSAVYGVTTIQGTTVSSGGGNAGVTIGGNIIQTSALGAMGIANFYNYANTSVCKSYAVQSFQPNGGTSTRYGGLNSFAAIDSITCTSPSSFNFTGGTYTVYGIR